MRPYARGKLSWMVGEESFHGHATSYLPSCRETDDEKADIAWSLSLTAGGSLMPMCSNCQKSAMSGVCSGVKLVHDESSAVKVDCCVMVDT